MTRSSLCCPGLQKDEASTWLQLPNFCWPEKNDGDSRASYTACPSSPTVANARRSTYHVGEELKKNMHGMVGNVLTSERTKPETLWQRYRQGWFTIIPEGERPEDLMYIEKWDMLIMLLLVFTALWVPLQVALFPLDMHPIMLCVDHLTCFFFTTDVLLQFFVAYPADRPSGSAGHGLYWEIDPVRIARHYTRLPLHLPFIAGGKAGWFWIDAASVSPDLVNIFSGGRSEVGSALRMLKSFKMIRLLRVFRMDHRVLRWQSTFGWSFYILDLTKFFFYTVVTCLWFACAWIVLEGNVTEGEFSYHTDEVTWLSALIDAKGDPCSPSASQDPVCVYTLAMYWATMTITSVGYGDIVPQNKLEYALCIGLIMFAGIFWSYVMGVVVNVVSNLDPYSVQFKQTMDDLNHMMQTKHIPINLRTRMRRYMHESKRTREWDRHQSLIETTISEKLQREVASVSRNKMLMERVYWYSALEEDAKLQIVKSMSRRFYEPWEYIRLLQMMFLIKQGSVVHKGRILRAGDIWGHENILLESQHLLDRCQPRTLTYCDVMSLGRTELHEVCRLFPTASKRIRRAQVRTAAYRAFCMTALQRQLQSKQPSSSRTVERLGSFRSDDNDDESEEPDMLASPSFVATKSANSQIDQHFSKFLNGVEGLLDRHHERLHYSFQRSVGRSASKTSSGPAAIVPAGSSPDSANSGHPWNITSSLGSVAQKVMAPLNMKQAVTPTESALHGDTGVKAALDDSPAIGDSGEADDDVLFKKVEALERLVVSSHADIAQKQADLSHKVGDLSTKLDNVTEHLVALVNVHAAPAQHSRSRSFLR